MNALGNRSCDEKERVAEAGRTELTQAASSNGGRRVRETRQLSPGCSIKSMWSRQLDRLGSTHRARRARTLAPLGAGWRGDGETPVHEEHAIRREPGTRTGFAWSASPALHRTGSLPCPACRPESLVC